jgi:hypothetical protein
MPKIKSAIRLRLPITKQKGGKNELSKRIEQIGCKIGRKDERNSFNHLSSPLDLRTERIKQEREDNMRHKIDLALFR